MIVFRHLRNRLFAAHDRDSLQIGTDFVRIIIYDTGYFPVQMFAVLHLPDKHIAGCACSNHHRHHRLRLTDALVVVVRDPEKTVGKPWNNNTYREKQDINKDIASRHRIVQQSHPAELYKRRQHDRCDRILKLLNAGKPPQTRVELADHIDQHRTDHIDPHITSDRLPEDRLNLAETKIKPHPQRAHHACDRQYYVKQKKSRSFDDGFSVLVKSMYINLHNNNPSVTLKLLNDDCSFCTAIL